MKINYDEFIKNNERRFKRLRLLLNEKPLPRCRPRDQEEELVLRIMAFRRWKKEMDEGKLIIVAPKKFKIVI